jgi:hypothetical protein
MISAIITNDYGDNITDGLRFLTFGNLKLDKREM